MPKLDEQRKYQIKQTGSSNWEFKNEAALEDFVWDNLEQLFNLIPLRRQHHASGNYCDILAINEKQGLVIIELKNSEDRYVVQQLTRYYHQLIKEKPYQEKIDYQQSIELIAISSFFHNDNLVDRSYHKLNFRFINFNLTEKGEDIYFQAKDLNSNTLSCLKIDSYIALQSKDRLQALPPPRSLNTALARCEDIDSSLVLYARKKILEFDNQIKEIQLGAGDFLYGKGKTKPCAQISIKRESSYGVVNYVLHFGLWLPVALNSSDIRSRVTRVIVSGLCVSTNNKFINLGLLQRGIGRTQKTTKFWRCDEYIWLFLEKELREKVDLKNLNPSIKKYCCIKGYPDPTKGSSETLDFFLGIALDTWKDKISSCKGK